MTRFILVSFAFLAWCFWELSGGASYESRVEAKPIFAPAIPLEERRTRADATQLAAANPLEQATSTGLNIPFLDLPTRDQNGPSPRIAEAEDPPQDDLSAQTDLLVRAALSGDEPESDAVTQITIALQPEPLEGLTTEGLSARSNGDGTHAWSARPTNSLDSSSLFTARSHTGNNKGINSGGNTGALTGQVITFASPPPSRITPSAAPTPTPTPTPAADMRRVSADNVNIREGPGTDFRVVDQVSEGMAVEVLSENGTGWLQLRVVDTGRVGYMADWLVTAKAE